MDLVTRVPRFPVPGETLLGSKFATYPGGKGANQASAIARLGGKPRFIGKVGNDSFGLQITSSMRQAGVDMTHVLAEQDVATGTAMITVSDSGENTIVVASGANGRVDAEFVSSCLSKIDFDTVLMQLETPVEVIGEVLTYGRLTILNPAPAAPLPARYLAGLDWITPNQSETKHYTGISPIDDVSCRNAAHWFLDQGVKNVVITLSSAGSFYASEDNCRHCETISVQTVDSTAAGDAFNGALALFLNEGREPTNAVLLANRAGALATTRMGAQTSLPTKEDLKSIAQDLL